VVTFLNYVFGLPQEKRKRRGTSVTTIRKLESPPSQGSVERNALRTAFTGMVGPGWSWTKREMLRRLPEENHQRLLGEWITERFA